MTKQQEIYKRKTILTQNIVWFLTFKQYNENIQTFKTNNKLNISIVRYKSSIRKMENLVQCRDLEITTLKHKIRDSENIIECMIDHQTVEPPANENKIKELESIIECLNLEMNNLETINKDLQDKNFYLLNTNNFMQNENKDLETKIKDLETKIKDLKHINKVLETTIERNDLDITTLEDTNNHLTDIVRQLNSKITRLENDVEYKTNRIERVLNLKINRLESVVEFKTNQIETLENRIKNSNNEKSIVECLTNQIETLENRIKNSNNENTTVYTHNYTNGDTYEGTALNNNNVIVRDGIGKMTYENGDIYSGFWSNGQRHGKGKLFSKSNKSLKCGVWKNGEFDGIITTYNFDDHDDPTINHAIKEEYKNGKCVRHIGYGRSREYNSHYNVGSLRNIKRISTFDDNEKHHLEYEYRYGGPSNYEVPLDLTPQYLYL
jgi:hypothetical protein